MSIPNYLTLLRIVLTPIFVTALISYEPGKEEMRILAISIFAIAGLTDALDGILARVLKQKTPLGQMLDPLADKFLLLSGYISLLFVHSNIYHPPLWVTISIIFRDIVLSIGFFTLYFLRIPFDAKPNWLGKCTTVLQMSLLVFILLKWPGVIQVAYITGLFTIVSGIVYLSIGIKRIQ